MLRIRVVWVTDRIKAKHLPIKQGEMEENKIKIATYNSLIRNVSVQGGRMQYNSQNNKSKMRINLLDNSSNRRHCLESLLQFVNVVSRNKKNL